MVYDLARVAELLHQRNTIDEQITQIIKRPVASGHLGEWIAAWVFDIELETSASTAAVDGRFLTGKLQGRTVNIKWYLKREGLLDMTTADVPDYYLVMTGPAGPAASSRGGSRLWRIDNVYLFDARQLLSDQLARGVKVGVASSVPQSWWKAAEIYPTANDAVLAVSREQAAMLALFRPR
ncbi:hypothetical protein JQS43_21990 [Natronosporangium hydrolyticum]|uniref:Uncharacterized protein n=1 Tax=Natronosporangium hydrolyticum TaxID=2811111 RepID=A0A895YD86_9ACTN|nr:hypothetical protein [Natronosporangium hydrolyticum]QSB14165.1 hypothetical protein JQS43_21990 [Natronosporangium hydrolyticum]